MSAMRLAMAYRERFARDVVIDVIGYRRYGHNETDEPAYTQPKMAAQIKAHTPVSEIYAEQLVKEGVVSTDDVAADSNEIQETLSTTLKGLREKMETGDYEDPTSTHVGTGELDRTKSPEVETAVSEKRIRTLNEELLRVPDGFAIHRKLKKPLEKRIEILEDGPIEWGHAEGLAYASLLTEGTHIRLTGQDTERGTFSHRHLVLHDEKTGLRYAPIQNLSGALAPFEVHNSPLSEIACLGFEYGYSAASPESLILWEAQFGDFANSAQVIIDQFLVAGESKWGQTTRLTLLLPHGYEGSGPEHSSARIERFIQLAAEGNIRLANPTTAAQYFHLIRRQARIAKPRPLIVFTPKGLLRLAGASSKLSDLTTGTFQFVMGDPRAEGREAEITKLVLCSGKVYYDMDGHDKREESSNVAIARVELLYPFARDQIRELIEKLPEPQAHLLGPGGAEEHGRLQRHGRADARARCPKASSSPTSAAPSAPRPPRATRSPIAPSRSASSSRRWRVRALQRLRRRRLALARARAARRLEQQQHQAQGPSRRLGRGRHMLRRGLSSHGQTIARRSRLLGALAAFTRAGDQIDAQRISATDGCVPSTAASTWSATLPPRRSRTKPPQSSPSVGTRRSATGAPPSSWVSSLGRLKRPAG